MKEIKLNDNIGEVPSQLAVIPTMDVVVFPHMVVPLLVLDEQIIKGIENALEGSKKVLLLATKEQPEGAVGPIGIEDLYNVGTVGSIMRVMRLPEGGIKLLVQGIVRALVEDISSENNILTVSLKPMPFESEESEKIESKIKQLNQLIDTMSSSGKIFGPDSQVILSQIKDPEKIADFILSHLSLTVSQAQGLLEKKLISDLLDGIYKELDTEIEISKVQETVISSARDSINKSQREYYLREQLKAIRKELGEDNDSEVDDLQKKLEIAKLSPEAELEAKKQLKRLEKIPSDSMENTVIRNYLDWVLNLPWGVYTDDNLDIANAKQTLDNDHFGLQDVKERILDYLSVRSLKNDCHTPILCFTGPPGVGKTSLGQSIAKSMGRKFFRISLGGVHDESEIRGHRRTYVGAMPGRFIQAIRKAGTNNPLIMIDEIDKIGRDQRGDPAAALLEVLDTEQNKNFYDNYLGIGFDLSKVLFIATANNLNTIPEPLRDRMEIINISGYTHDEKLEIAKKHLVNKSLKNFGLDAKKVKIPAKVLDIVVNKYTREAGVRQLERLIQKLCAKYARSLVEEKKEVSFTPENITNYLGTFPVPSYANFHKDRIGVTNGLAWTPYGGEVLQVEAMLMPGTGKLILTGQLGDVMKESAQAALSYARANSNKFDIPKELFTNFDLHIHLPAGAIPKDGPSAGITLLSSILSALTKRPVNCQFAMTGELNLQGEVLPIGGLKEKILAAKQEGLANIIVPRLNEQDLESIGDIKKGINIFLVDNVSEVMDKVLKIK